MNKNLILRLANDAIDAFHDKYPDEDPFIRVVCMRHYRNANKELDLRGSWRGTIVDNKTRETVLRDLPVKKTIKVSKEKVNGKEWTEGRVELHKARVARDEKTLIKTAERMDMKLEVTYESTPNIRAEYVIDSTSREYDNRLVIRGVNCFEVLEVESVEPISVPLGTVVDVTDMGTLEASIMDSKVIKNRNEDLNKIIREINVKKAKVDMMVKKMGKIKEETTHLKEALSGLKETLRLGVESTKSLLADHNLYEKIILVKEPESKTIIGRMSIEDLASKYIQQQIRLNKIKSQILWKIGISVERHNDSIKKNGFILTIPEIIGALVDDNNRLCDLLKFQNRSSGVGN